MKTADKYKETIKAYSRLGKKYIENTEKHGLLMQTFDFIKLLPDGGKVLDVGCAGGRDSRKFLEEGFQVVGIDVVDIFLSEAKKKARKAKFLKMDVRKLKFSKDYFDGIWAVAILLHLERKDVPKVLENFHKILKKGGKLFIGVRKGKGADFSVDKLSGGERRFFTYFSKKEITELLKGAGFKIIYNKIFPDDVGRKDIKWIRVIAEKK